MDTDAGDIGEVYQLNTRPLPTATSAHAFMRAVGVKADLIERYANLIEDGCDVPYDCKELLQSLSKRVPLPDLFEPQVLARLASCSLADTVWYAVHHVDLFELEDRSYPNQWTRCTLLGERELDPPRTFHRYSCGERDDFPLLANSQHGQWYFHGTLANCVASIVRGIDLNHSRTNQDFNTRPSFYLDQNYTEARAWAIRKAQAKLNAGAAVVAYFALKVVEAELWQQVVTLSRTGKRGERDDLLGSMSPHWISGPVCANPQEVTDLDATAIQRFGSSQLALCTEHAAIRFSELVPFVVYLTRA